VTTADGEPLGTTGALRAAGAFDIRTADGTVPARVDDTTAGAGSAAPDHDPDRRPDGRS
jgi:hypothetical protein